MPAISTTAARSRVRAGRAASFGLPEASPAASYIGGFLEIGS